MKCASCGAETRGKFCEYCGSELPQAPSPMQHDPETTESTGKCPRCGSANITFTRERINTTTRSHSHKNVVGFGRTGRATSASNYRTVGLCQNCGCTWDPNNRPKQRRKLWLWVLGWLFLFPLPVTILLLRKKDMKPGLKYGIIAAVWVLFLLLGATGEPAETPAPTDSVPATTAAEQQEVPSPSLEAQLEEVVGKYNEVAEAPLVFAESFTPSDKTSDHYRTEFRLPAFENAIGRSYRLGDKVVDLVAYETYTGTFELRIYTNDTSLEQVLALIRGMSPILDETLTASDLQETLSDIAEEKTANGYYYGQLGLTLFGSDETGYELMLKTD